MTDPLVPPTPEQETRPLPDLPPEDLSLAVLEARLAKQEADLRQLQRDVRWIETQVAIQRRTRDTQERP